MSDANTLSTRFPDLFARTKANFQFPLLLQNERHRHCANYVVRVAFGGARATPLADYNNNATIAHGINQFTMFPFLSFSLFPPRHVHSFMPWPKKGLYLVNLSRVIFHLYFLFGRAEQPGRRRRAAQKMIYNSISLSTSNGSGKIIHKLIHE